MGCSPSALAGWSSTTARNQRDLQTQSGAWPWPWLESLAWQAVATCRLDICKFGATNEGEESNELPVSLTDLLNAMLAVMGWQCVFKLERRRHLKIFLTLPPPNPAVMHVHPAC
eukprot:307873-Amphidinium_carterae.1